MGGGIRRVVILPLVVVVLILLDGAVPIDDRIDDNVDGVSLDSTPLDTRLSINEDSTLVLGVSVSVIGVLIELI
jgi:hypothetical protein